MSPVANSTRVDCNAGSEPASKAGEQRNAGGKQQDTGVNIDPDPEWQFNRNRRVHQRDQPEGAESAGDASENSQEQAFGEQLSNEPGATRAERRAHRQLTFAGGGAREQKLTHIGAGDDENAAAGREQEQQ